MRIIFVGERRSPTARRMRVRWADGRLAAKQLFDAFAVVGYSPGDAVFLNAYEPGARSALAGALAEAIPVIAMGRKAQAKLDAWHIPYEPMVHPAARGRIRHKSVYPVEVRRALAAVGFIASAGVNPIYEPLDI